MKNQKFITRRDFLRGTACGAAGLAFGLPLPRQVKGQGEAQVNAAEGSQTPKPTSRVVLVRNPAVLDSDQKLQGEVLAEMLDAAVCALGGSQDPAQRYR